MRRPVSAGCDTLPMFDVLEAIFGEATPSESKTENDARFVLLSRLASRLQSIFRSARSASRRKQIGNLIGAAPVT